MAAPNNKTLCIVLTSVVLAFVGGCHDRLILTMDLKADTNFCGHLNCWNTGTSDEVIFAIVSISLYDISQPEVRIQLATVKSDGTGIKINQSKTSEVVGAGCINRYDADLSVNLMNQQDCQSGSFLCELQYIDTDGHSDTLIAHSKSVNSSGQCDCSELTSQQSDIARQMNTLRQNYTLEMAFMRKNNIEELKVLTQIYTKELKVLTQNHTVELADLNQQYSRLMTQFQNMSEELALIKNQTSRLEDKTFQSTTTENKTLETKQGFQTSLRSKCSKGMEHNSSHVKFLLWGQIPALCDTHTDGGGWVIIQRRTNAVADFYRNWQSYKKGFETPETDFWLGNDVIHNLTSHGFNELRVDMVFNNVSYYAQYKVFNVGDEQQSYRLSVSGYTGTAGDSLAPHDNMMFSTYDRDNDMSTSNYAVLFHAAWWYKPGYYSSLNGVWKMNEGIGILWPILGSTQYLTFTELKVRHLNI